MQSRLHWVLWERAPPPELISALESDRLLPFYVKHIASQGGGVLWNMYSICFCTSNIDSLIHRESTRQTIISWQSAVLLSSVNTDLLLIASVTSYQSLHTWLVHGHWCLYIVVVICSPWPEQNEEKRHEETWDSEWIINSELFELSQLYCTRRQESTGVQVHFVLWCFKNDLQF